MYEIYLILLYFGNDMLPVLVVSLKHDVIKRQAIAEKLSGLNINFEFIDAVYGKELSDFFCNSLQLKGKIKSRGFPPTRGEIGCSLSHISAYSHIISKEMDWVCILEDDAILDERFSRFLYLFDEKKFNINNIYILGGQEGLSPSRYISKSFFKKIKCENQYFYRVNNTDKYVNRTCCYMIHRDLTIKMIDIFSHGFYLADDWQSFKKEGVYQYMYLSNFVAHPLDLTLSSIEQEREAARNLNAFTSKGLIYNLVKKTYLIGQFFYTQLKRFY